MEMRHIIYDSCLASETIVGALFSSQIFPASQYGVSRILMRARRMVYCDMSGRNIERGKRTISHNNALAAPNLPIDNAMDTPHIP